MIYECFMFLNEFDMLELKLQEHYPFVDKFIITESNKNFNQEDKEYILETQWNRYKKYHDKIIYQKFDATGYEPGWHTQNAQRDYLNIDIKFTNNDIIISDDIDEILLPDDWNWIINEDLKQYKEEISFAGTPYVGYANFRCDNYPHGQIIVIPGHLFKKLSEHKGKFFYENGNIVMRERNKIVKEGALHLTWFGDKKSFEEKFKGHIEAKKWSKENKTNLEDSWTKRKQGIMFNFKPKYKDKILKKIPVEENEQFTKTMKEYILKQKEWIYNE